ncbi:HD domain-containing phosphohydrolase [Fervidobacterium pennivorans subsp. carthaginiensis]|uniref:HD domain-containing phosphohydrolase n=1 Tax=Fervidobacterium pennivorans TaxID=93466 RepID=UPI00355B16E0
MKLKHKINQKIFKVYIFTFIFLMITFFFTVFHTTSRVKNIIFDLQKRLNENILDELSSGVSQYDSALSNVISGFIDTLKTLPAHYRAVALHEGIYTTEGKIVFREATKTENPLLNRVLKNLAAEDYLIYTKILKDGVYKAIYLKIDNKLFCGEIQDPYNSGILQRMTKVLEILNMKEFVILDADLTPVYSTGSFTTNAELYKKIKSEIAGLNEPAIVFEHKHLFDRNIVMYGFINLKTNSAKSFVEPIYFYVTFDLSSYLQLILSDFVAFLSILIISNFLFLVSVKKVSEEITSPLERLTESINRFSDTMELNKLATNTDIDEIKVLIERYNTMMEEITTKHEEIMELNKILNISFTRLLEYQKEVEQAYISFANQLAIIAENYDEVTGNHIERVGELSAYFAKKLNWGPEQIEKIRIFSRLHDIGKILIPKEILNKKGKLTDEEFELIKKHVEYGARILGDLPYFEIARNIALYHHEKWDGTGYMSGLKGEEIPIEARIVALVDVYDALRSERPYKKALTHEEAVRIILEGDEKTKPEHFDPTLIRILVENSEEIRKIWDKVNSLEK